ncbi:MAG: AraC family transcriptional regulator [Cyclobacteriaceae bacterium]
MLTVGLIQAFISGLVFLFRKPNHLSNKLLFVWFCIIALTFLGKMLPKGIVAYIKIGLMPVILLYGPILYFYVQSLIDEQFSFRGKQLWHLFPFVALCIIRVFVFPNSFEYGRVLNANIELKDISLIVVIITSLAGYWIVTLFLLAKHRKNLKNHFSHESQKLVLNWIWLIMLIYIVNQLLGFLAPLFKDFFGNPSDIVFWFFQFNLAIFTYLLTIFGIQQPIIFETDNNKYDRSGLRKEQLQELSKQIGSYLEEKKPFLNPEYNLQQMSQDLDIPRQYLSQTINEIFSKNFYQLINTYRVEQVKQLLQSPASQRLTLEGLAYEAGFNSKASFYRIFKEITGQTPSVFKRLLSQQNS